MESNHRCWLIAVCATLFALSAKSAWSQHLVPTLFPGQRSVQVRDPSQLAKYRIYDSPPPPTVSTKEDLEPFPVSLDDVIRFSLGRTDVVRVLTGATATSSGRTIYDAAITNTTIDQNNARFDPVLSSNSEFLHLENPQAVFDPVDPTQTLLGGYITDGFSNSTGLTKLNALGGTTGLSWNWNDRRFRPQFNPLNPQSDDSTTLSYTQPLLKGAGIRANVAPIVIARINTEISYFVLKDSVQEMVRGVIEGYWVLVAARTDVWSKQQQIEQLEEKGSLHQDSNEAGNRKPSRLVTGSSDTRQHTCKPGDVTSEHDSARRCAAELDWNASVRWQAIDPSHATDG